MSEVPQRPRIRPATSDDWGPSDRSGRGAASGPQGQEHGSNPAEADFDRSTYYEYIERHTGDLPLSRTRHNNVFAPAGGSPFADRAHPGVSGDGPLARSGSPSADPRRGGSAGAGAPGYGAGEAYRGPADSGGFAAVGGAAGAYGPGQGAYGVQGAYGPGAYGPGGSGPGGPNSGAGPAVRSRRSTWAKVVVVILAILLVLTLVGYFGVRWLAPSTGTVPVDVGEDEAQSASPSPSDELVQPSGSPEEQLDDLVAASTDKASGLEGRWVTQVSAKKVGLEADGKTWSAQDILDEYKANEVKYPGSILIYSGDWGSYKVGDYWVTVVDTPYSDPEPALDKCRSWGLDRDHCLAKRLVKDGEYSEGNSAYLEG